MAPKNRRGQQGQAQAQAAQARAAAEARAQKEKEEKEEREKEKEREREEKEERAREKEKEKEERQREREREREEIHVHPPASTAPLRIPPPSLPQTQALSISPPQSILHPSLSRKEHPVTPSIHHLLPSHRDSSSPEDRHHTNNSNTLDDDQNQNHDRDDSWIPAFRQKIQDSRRQMYDEQIQHVRAQYNQRLKDTGWDPERRKWLDNKMDEAIASINRMLEEETDRAVEDEKTVRRWAQYGGGSGSGGREDTFSGGLRPGPGGRRVVAESMVREDRDRESGWAAWGNTVTDDDRGGGGGVGGGNKRRTQQGPPGFNTPASTYTYIPPSQFPRTPSQNPHAPAPAPAPAPPRLQPSISTERWIPRPESHGGASNLQVVNTAPGSNLGLGRSRRQSISSTTSSVEYRSPRMGASPLQLDIHGNGGGFGGFGGSGNGGFGGSGGGGGGAQIWMPSTATRGGAGAGPGPTSPKTTTSSLLDHSRSSKSLLKKLRPTVESITSSENDRDRDRDRDQWNRSGAAAHSDAGSEGPPVILERERAPYKGIPIPSSIPINSMPIPFQTSSQQSEHGSRRESLASLELDATREVDLTGTGEEGMESWEREVERRERGVRRREEEQEKREQEEREAREKEEQEEREREEEQNSGKKGKGGKKKEKAGMKKGATSGKPEPPPKPEPVPTKTDNKSSIWGSKTDVRSSATASATKATESKIEDENMRRQEEFRRREEEIKRKKLEASMNGNGNGSNRSNASSGWDSPANSNSTPISESTRPTSAFSASAWGKPSPLGSGPTQAAQAPRMSSVYSSSNLNVNVPVREYPVTAVTAENLAKVASGDGGWKSDSSAGSVRGATMTEEEWRRKQEEQARRQQEQFRRSMMDKGPEVIKIASTKTSSSTAHAATPKQNASSFSSGRRPGSTTGTSQSASAIRDQWLPNVHSRSSELAILHEDPDELEHLPVDEKLRYKELHLRNRAETLEQRENALLQQEEIVRQRAEEELRQKEDELLERDSMLQQKEETIARREEVVRRRREFAIQKKEEELVRREEVVRAKEAELAKRERVLERNAGNEDGFIMVPGR